MVYQPSRDIADSSGKLYEITFTDDYGKAADLKDIEHYTIRKRESGETLSYAIPDGLPSTEARARSAQHFDFSQLYGEKGGQVWPPTRAGAVLLFGNKGGDEGRAKWLSPGKWERVPCSFSGTSGQFVGPLERLGR